MAEGELSRDEKGTDYKTKAAAEKKAEVIGNVAHTEVDVESPYPSESGDTIQRKPTRCTERVSLVVAIVLGVVLVIILVYFQTVHGLVGQKRQLVSPTTDGLDDGSTTELTSTVFTTTTLATTTEESMIQPRIMPRGLPGRGR